jgi:hypothetical protein
MTADEAAEDPDSLPAPFLAWTVNVYLTPLTKPVTVQVRAATAVKVALVEQVRADEPTFGDAVTV